MVNINKKEDINENDLITVPAQNCPETNIIQLSKSGRFILYSCFIKKFFKTY